LANKILLDFTLQTNKFMFQSLIFRHSFNQIILLGNGKSDFVGMS